MSWIRCSFDHTIATSPSESQDGDSHDQMRTRWGRHRIRWPRGTNLAHVAIGTLKPRRSLRNFVRKLACYRRQRKGKGKQCTARATAILHRNRTDAWQSGVQNSARSGTREIKRAFRVLRRHPGRPRLGGVSRLNDTAVRQAHRVDGARREIFHCVFLPKKGTDAHE